MGLERFVIAQGGGVYERAVGEIRAGVKRSHWMWFVFPQIAGLGVSETSRFYAVRDRAEAEEYLAHNLLGARLLDCCIVLARLENTTAERVFGSVDAMKLCSSLTLFEAVGDDPVFGELLDRFFDGRRDQATLQRL